MLIGDGKLTELGKANRQVLQKEHTIKTWRWFNCHKMDKNKIDISKPVSYTHLDVYKRQT